MLNEAVEDMKMTEMEIKDVEEASQIAVPAAKRRASQRVSPSRH